MIICIIHRRGAPPQRFTPSSTDLLQYAFTAITMLGRKRGSRNYKWDGMGVVDVNEKKRAAFEISKTMAML